MEFFSIIGLVLYREGSEHDKRGRDPTPRVSQITQATGIRAEGQWQVRTWHPDRALIAAAHRLGHPGDPWFPRRVNRLHLR